MSADESKRPEASGLPAHYRVGYKRPPVEHRFTKGRSGNPNGRPKGARNQPKVDMGYGMKPAEEFLRIEAYRPVTIREGENFVELPTIQAVFRAMGVSAMKGNRFAQRSLAELVTRMEEEDRRSRMELLEWAVEYKRNWSQEFARCEKLGIPPPEPIPHPDDIILDPKTGAVRIMGPQTKEQKDHYDQSRSRREEAQEEVSYFAAKYRNETDPAMKQQWLEEWHWEQRMFDILNDAMPKRYQMKLDDRSFRPGASRQGKTMQEFMEDRKRPPDQRRWEDYVER